VLSEGVAVFVWMGLKLLGTQVRRLSRGEWLECVVPVSVHYHLADEVGGESERCCSTCALALCRLVGILDLARDEGECQWGCVVECDSELMHEQLTRRLVPGTVHKDVMDIVQRRGQTGSISSVLVSHSLTLCCLASLFWPARVHHAFLDRYRCVPCVFRT